MKTVEAKSHSFDFPILEVMCDNKDNKIQGFSSGTKIIV
jgi:hypothetical protein